MIKKILAVWIVAASLSCGIAQAQSDLVGLYLSWQRDPTTTMTINWVNLYEHTTTNIWFRETGTEKWESRTGTRHQAVPSGFQVRRAELTQLKPDTNYEFTIGDEPSKDGKNLQKFRTMPAKMTRPVRFVNGGDMMHSREFLDAMNAQAARLDPDFAFIVGDIAYENGELGTRFFDWFQSWTKLMRGKNGRIIPLVAGIGNHEVRGHYAGKIPVDAPYYYAFFANPKQKSYFALDFGKYLSLVVLDSGHTQPIQGAQTEWLVKTLAERTKQQFLFAGYHWPVYGTSKASEGKLPSEHERSIEIRTNWITQFERHGVSAIFEHDHHTFKRSHRIRNHQRDDENGLLYLGDGAWGVNTRTPISPEKAWYLAKSEARRHLFDVALHPDGHAEIRAIDADGKAFDEIILDKPRTRPE